MIHKTLKEIIDESEGTKKSEMLKREIYNNKDKIIILNGYFDNDIEFQMKSSKEKENDMEEFLFSLFVHNKKRNNIYCYGYMNPDRVFLTFLCSRSSTTTKTKIICRTDIESRKTKISRGVQSFYNIRNSVSTGIGRTNIFDQKTLTKENIKKIIWG